MLSPASFGPAFLYYLVTQPEFVDYLVANADGSAYPAVRADHFAAAQVLVPTRMMREAFDELAMPILDMIHQGDIESSILAATRDTLLPKLISGQIRLTPEEEDGDGR